MMTDFDPCHVFRTALDDLRDVLPEAAIGRLKHLPLDLPGARLWAKDGGYSPAEIGEPLHGFLPVYRIMGDLTVRVRYILLTNKGFMTIVDPASYPLENFPELSRKKKLHSAGAA